MRFPPRLAFKILKREISKPEKAFPDTAPPAHSGGLPAATEHFRGGSGRGVPRGFRGGSGWVRGGSVLVFVGVPRGFRGVPGGSAFESSQSEVSPAASTHVVNAAEICVFYHSGWGLELQQCVLGSSISCALVDHQKPAVQPPFKILKREKDDFFGVMPAPSVASATQGWRVF